MGKFKLEKDAVLLLKAQNEYANTCGIKDASMLMEMIYRVWKYSFTRKIGSWQYPTFEKDELTITHRKKKIAVQFENHKLKCVWSFEAVEDLKMVSNIDPIEEIKAILSQELSLEIDRYVIMKMRKHAYDNHAKLTFALKHINENKRKAFSDFIRFQSEFDWILASPEIEPLIDYDQNDIDNFSLGLGISYKGKIGNTKVYVDPLLTINNVIMGKQGDVCLATGPFTLHSSNSDFDIVRRSFHIDTFVHIPEDAKILSIVVDF